MIEISGPKVLTLPSAFGGNDYIYGLTLVCVTRGLFVEDISNTHVKIDGITSTSLLTVSLVRILLSASAEVKGYPAFFELDNVTDVCPFSDSDETWAQWGVVGQSHAPVKIGEKWYRSSCFGASGEKLAASVWGAVESLTVLSDVEYLAIASPK